MHCENLVWKLERVKGLRALIGSRTNEVGVPGKVS